MDLKQLEYIIAIEEYGNISKAAEKMFVSPSAMNQQLLKLETELGLPLFVRNHRHMEPTAAGRLYLENARAVMDIKRNTYSAIKDMLGQYNGEYRIGLPMEHGMDAFLNCYGPFRDKFPNIQLICQEGMVHWQMEQIRAGTLDIAFVLLTDRPETDDQYLELSQENLLLGMPRSHPLSYLATESKEEFPLIDLTLLKDENFALMRRSSTQRKRLDPLFNQAGYAPKVIMESTQNRAIRNIAAKQLCCCVIPQTYAMEDTENLVWFSVPSFPRFTFYAMLKKDLRPSKPISYLISLIQDYAKKNYDFPLPSAAKI